MTQHEMQFDVTGSIDHVLAACQESAHDLQWRVLSVSQSGLSIREMPKSLLGSGPIVTAKMDVALSGQGMSTYVRIRGSILGMGPVPRKYLEGVMGSFVNGISVRLQQDEARSDRQESGSIDIAGQLERLAMLHREGTLTDEEFGAAKKRIVGA
jgi:hypothetical protein